MDPAQFIELTFGNVAALLIVGFIGGLVSGFIGSGGAFVLTPAMMTMGVPAVVAVASNICHKFPKAIVGAYRRYQFGHVDVKLGLTIAASASVGVWIGADIQHGIKSAYGEAGSNLYVSLAFVVVLTVVGSFVLRDVWRVLRQNRSISDDHLTRLARWVQSVEIPGTMMRFGRAGCRVSALFTIPLGLATGMLAATIAVGGFIGVPGMMYVLGAPGLVASATELVIAFIMGLGGTIKYALHGLVDIRLTLILLAGSLFGVQLGAIGTTYVRPVTIKIVMAASMLIVAVSRALMIPVYLAELGYGKIDGAAAAMLAQLSFAFMVAALATGGLIIIVAMLRGRQSQAQESPEPASDPQRL